MANSSVIHIRLEKEKFDQVELVREALGWTRTQLVRSAIDSFLMGADGTFAGMQENIHNENVNAIGQDGAE